MDPSPILGRAAEVAALDGALRDARIGRGSLHLIVGEPGIGKTRLAREIADRATGAGGVVVWGRCWEAGGAPPLWPWTEAMRALRDHARAKEAIASLGDDAARLGELVPSVAPQGRGRVVEHESADAARFRTFDAARRFLRAIASPEAPVVVVLDDVHAADRQTMLLLRFVADEIERANVVVIATMRDREARHREDLGDVVAPLVRRARVHRPARLDRATAGELVRSALGDRVSSETIAVLHETSEGNPLFLHELARVVAQRGDAALRSGPLPAATDDVIRAHLSVLSDASRRVLEVAAVLGRAHARSAIVLACRRALGLEASAVDAALAEGVAAEVILRTGESPPSFAFAHVLLRDGLYEAIEPARRAALHAQIAGVLAELDRPASERAHHVLEAMPHVAPTEAVNAVIGASDEAVRRHAFDDAGDLLDRAIAAFEALADAPPALLAELLLRAGEAHTARGFVQRGKECAERAAALARRIGDARLLGRAALVHGIELSMGVSDRVMIALLEEALAAVGPEPSALRARLLARYSCARFPCEDPEVPIALAREAMAMEKAIGDPELRLVVWTYAMPPLAMIMPASELAEHEIEVARIARAIGNDIIVSRATMMGYCARLAQGDVAGAEAMLEETCRVAERLPQPTHRWRAVVAKSLHATREGRLEEAARLAREAEAIVDSGPAPMPLRALMFRRLIELRMTRDLEALAREKHEMIDDLAKYPHGWALIASIHAALGDLAAARSALARRNTKLFGRPPAVLVAAAEAAAAVGDREMCAELYELLLPRSRAGEMIPWAMVSLAIDGSVDRVMGLLAAALGRRGDALAYFTRCEELDESTGARPHLAHTLVEHARVLAASGEAEDVGGAVRLLGRAADLYASMGLEARARDARALIAELGGERGATAPSAKRPSERPVATENVTAVREGDVFRIAWSGGEVRVKDSKGMRYLVELLARPSEELHATQLVALAEGVDRAELPRGDAGEMLDREAKQAYRRRIEDLREQIEEATELGDAARAERARTEIDAIAAELARAVGLGGRDRRAAATAERARVNVQRRLRSALDAIAKHAPALARHLEKSLRTGTFCSYDP